jgi:transposase-like protein
MEVSFKMAVKGQKFRKYEKEFKIEVVEAYLSGMQGGLAKVAKRYDLRIKRVEDWVKIYREKGSESFWVETRGKHGKGGRSKSIKLDEMTKDEQIKYLKMEVDILKKAKALQKN